MARQLIKSDHRVEAIQFHITYGEGPFHEWESITAPSLDPVTLAEEDSHAADPTRAGGFQDHPEVRRAKTDIADLFNGRTVSIVSASHMLQIAEDMRLPIEHVENRVNGPIEEYMMRMLGANILLGGNDATFSHLFPGTQIFFGDTEQPYQGAITLEGYIDPCKKPTLQLWHSLGMIGLQPELEFDAFKTYAKSAMRNRRGWAGWISAYGAIEVGHGIVLHQPSFAPKEDEK